MGKEFQDGYGVVEKIAEIHSVVAHKLLLIGAIDVVGDFGKIIMHFVPVAVHVHHLVLGILYQSTHQAGGILLIIYPHFLDQAGNHP